jgi:hypothetical protein
MKYITHKLDDDVKDVLARSSIAGSNLRLPEDLERGHYVKVNKAIELLGGRWNRSAKAHVFQQSGDDIKRLWNDAVETGAVIDKVKTFQFYETPRQVVIDMLEYMGIGTNDTVLEPSAGHGAILDVIREQHPHTKLVAVELDADKCEILKGKGYEPVQGDFLEHNAQYDCIVANPPFSKKQDVVHILHMYECLKPGGSLIAIAGWGVQTNSDKKTKALQALVAEHGNFVGMANNSFKSEGTGVRTCFVLLRKPSEVIQ